MDMNELLTYNFNKEQFIALRNEICQSIDKQHQIALGGYGLSAAIFGYMLGMKTPNFDILIIIPFIFLTMTSLWTVECNRMVRAGYFIGKFLLPTMQEEAHIVDGNNWETWIRSEDRHATIFRKIQNHLQLFVIVIVPILISIICLIIGSLSLWKRTQFIVIFIIIFNIILWFYVILAVLKVSNLRAVLYKENRSTSQ